MCNSPEILAPAGTWDAMVAAVRCGADAVYLGGTEFNARRNAGNFDRDQLREAVAYCHIRGVRVYLTLNIMLRDGELSDAVEVARHAMRCGIDGIILQDIGLTRILHGAFPELPLHASTQMSVHSPAALPVLKELGICRVVAAREMSREELRALCTAAEALGMTVEVFVHGALCMSVSGQCLLSAVLGGRSGNRGLCAGPCRLPFAAPGGTGYDLSLKDLSLSAYLGELAGMGAASFKIEGRMKRPEYVAAATAACRAALDTGRVPGELSDALRNVFSRSGFTDGYYTGKRGRQMFGIRTRDDVVSAEDAFPRLHELYRGERQSVPLQIELSVTAGTPAVLTFSDGTHTVTVTGDVPEPAGSRPLTAEAAEDAVAKLGGTPYRAERIRAEVGDGLFLRGAALNAMRRDAVERLDAERARPAVREERTPEYSGTERRPAGEPKRIARFASPEQIPARTDGVFMIVLPLENSDYTPPAGIRLAVELPRGIADETAIRKMLSDARARGIDTALCGTLSGVMLAREAGMRVIGGIGLNLCNGEALDVMQKQGVQAAVLSAETLLTDAVQMPAPIPKGIFAYGRLPLMLTRNCPVSNGRSCAECDHKASLTDRKGVEFPVRCRMGFSELYNSLPVWLADRMDETRGLDFLLLYFTDESPEQAQTVLHAYHRGGTAPGKFTRGMLYHKTV